MFNIKKYDFINTLDYIDRREKLADDIAKAYTKNNIPNDFYADYAHVDSTAFDYIIHLLELLTGDETGWISWFVFENDFGRKHSQCWDEDGNAFYIDTLGQLYDFLYIESEQKDDSRKS